MACLKEDLSNGSVDNGPPVNPQTQVGPQSDNDGNSSPQPQVSCVGSQGTQTAVSSSGLKFRQQLFDEMYSDENDLSINPSSTPCPCPGFLERSSQEISELNEARSYLVSQGVAIEEETPEIAELMDYIDAQVANVHVGAVTRFQWNKVHDTYNILLNKFFNQVNHTNKEIERVQQELQQWQKLYYHSDHQLFSSRYVRCNYTN